VIVPTQNQEKNRLKIALSKDGNYSKLNLLRVPKYLNKFN